LTLFYALQSLKRGTQTSKECNHEYSSSLDMYRRLECIQLCDPLLDDTRERVDLRLGIASSPEGVP
jgi:hypothetical protein